MAKILDLNRFLNRYKSVPPSFKNDSDPSDSGRKSRSKVLPIDIAKGVHEDSWPTSSSRTSLHAGAGLLLAIGILCGLYLGRVDKKATMPGSKPPNAQVQTGAAPQPSVQARPLSKPSPIVPADKVEGSIEAGEAPPNMAPALPSTPRYLSTRFEATHKKVFGGCTGQLELTAARLYFRCPNKPDLNLPVDTIAKAHKNGVELKSGEKYHFIIANHTKDQAEAIFISWLNRVQQLPQTNRAAAY